MNEQTMIWFLQKSARYQLSRQAVMLWMDFYAYLQNQNRACYPQISFQELAEAAMLSLQVQEGRLVCRLVAGRLYCTPRVTAG